jgi:hypothetical protein
MRSRRVTTLAAALVLAICSIGAGTAAAQAAGAKTAPAGCRVFNPLFEWKAGQERALRAADAPCDAAPGKRSWLILQRNGNLVFYMEGDQLWTSDTKGEGKKLVERGYGGLDIENGQGSTIWGTGAPGAEGFEPHPNGGFGIGFETDEGGPNDAFTHWDQSEGLCGPGGACGQTLWTSGKGVS